MKLLFLGLLYPREEEGLLLSKSSCGLQTAANNYQWGLIDGLDKVSGDGIRLLSSLPVGTFPKNYKELLIPSRSWSHNKEAQDREIGYINLPVIKQLMRFYRMYKEANTWCKHNQGEEAAILFYSLYPFYLKILALLKKKYKNICMCLIFPDVPNLPGYRRSHSILRRLIYDIKVGLVYHYIRSADVHVLLTENMLIPLRFTDKPYVIIEGISSLDPLGAKLSQAEPAFAEHEDYIANQDNEIIFLYTGALIRDFGMDKMLSAFQSMPEANYRLWICGTGDYRREAEAAASSDSRIIYYGYVTREESLKLQRRATILINPRSDDCEYTRYSFPSKTMEYLSSAKPVLCFRLEGIPREYDEYLYYIEENTVEGFARAMRRTAEIPLPELLLHGKKAREFVAENKNCMVQAGKIYDLLKLYQSEQSMLQKSSSHVLQINITCQSGSTGKIVEDIHNYITKQGYQSHIAYSAYQSYLKNSFKIESKFENYLRRALNRYLGRKYLHSAPGTFRLIKNIKRLKPDIIHLHNIQQNSVHFPLLMKFLAKYDAPVVYTLHDCWPFTGGCYHFTASGCTGYRRGCLQCPLDKDKRDICNKSAQKVYAQKDKALHALRRLKVVCISDWQYSCAIQSYLKDLPLRVIHNAVNTKVFRPIEVNLRQELGISEQEFVILGVASVWTNKKGLDIFLRLSQYLSRPCRIVLAGKLNVQVPEQIITFQESSSTIQLVRLYNSADVFFNASKEEAFGLTSVEAMACGVPVIAYNSTACAEVAGPDTGVILNSPHMEELLKAIKLIRENGKASYRENCINRAESLFSRERMLEEYLRCYEEFR